MDASLRSLPVILPVLDFSTIKNDLFPVIASVFSKTSSLGIKVRGLEAFVILCGGSSDSASNDDGLDGIVNASKKSSSTSLDKYTMQEKIIPLIKGIKTKEPAVAIAALNVLRQVGRVADEEFVAMDILPILWSMSLGPLLDLNQFQSFMDLIKTLSSQVEANHTKKLAELSGTNGSKTKGNDDFMSFGGQNAFASSTADGAEIDFESLVKGTAVGGAKSNPMDSAWDANPARATAQPTQITSNNPQPITFSWSTPSPSAPTGYTTSGNSGASIGAQRTQQGSRAITPDLSQFNALSPTTTQFSQPLQPTQQRPSSYTAPPLQPQGNYSSQAQVHSGYNSSTFQPPLQAQPTQGFQNPPAAVNWGAPASNPWATSNTPSSNPPMAGLGQPMSTLSMGQQRPAPSFSLPPPPGATNNPSFPPPPSAFGGPPQAKPQAKQKSGLDAYESLI